MTYMPINDAEADRTLMERIRNGGGDGNTAFAQLYDKYANRIYGYVRKMLLDHPVLIDDVYQTTFVKFYEQIAAGTVIENTGGYLLRIARNLALNELAKRRRLVFTTEDIHMAASNHESNDLGALLDHALQQLPDDYRESVILREHTGLDYTEIAELTGQTEATIRQRVSRGKAMLRQILAPILDR
ncbi:MAG: sigma-70 family RNA polymerase sigma factor [Candidatus Kapabacteria bacterium]|nr:sigma-70 family RNA polymerase sigma factor [Candidatus Kapabacteria bacterium]